MLFGSVVTVRFGATLGRLALRRFQSRSPRPLSRVFFSTASRSFLVRPAERSAVRFARALLVDRMPVIVASEDRDRWIGEEPDRVSFIVGCKRPAANAEVIKNSIPRHE